MDSIGITTSQNIQIQQKLASAGHRLLAFIIDWLVLIAYSLLTLYLYSLLNLNSIALQVLMSLPVLLYFPVVETFMNGQTIGKRSMQIRVIKQDGSQPGISAYLLRWLLGLLEFYMAAGGLAVLMIIFNKNGQRLGDLAGGTVVVREARSLRGIQRDLHTMNQVDEDYEPRFTEVRKLDDHDMRLIKQATRAFRQNGVREPMEVLQPKLEEKMQVGPTNLHPLKFLDTVLKDYTYYSLKQAERT